MGQRRESDVLFASQNVRGLSDDKLETIADRMREHGIMAMCLQETWLDASAKNVEIPGYEIISRRDR